MIRNEHETFSTIVLVLEYVVGGNEFLQSGPVGAFFSDPQVPEAVVEIVGQTVIVCTLQHGVLLREKKIQKYKMSARPANIIYSHEKKIFASMHACVNSLSNVYLMIVSL